MNQDLFPAHHAVAITPNDSASIHQARAVYVGTAGDLRLDMPSGATITLNNLAAGVVHPIQARRIYATGTTAADIVALY